MRSTILQSSISISAFAQVYLDVNSRFRTFAIDLSFNRQDSWLSSRIKSVEGMAFLITWMLETRVRAIELLKGEEDEDDCLDFFDILSATRFTVVTLIDFRNGF